jgi:cytosine/adenosine deaminase-related metal-dependent hydrolase
VSEQRSEVTDALTHHQTSPIGLLHRHHLLAPHTTLVHAIHLIEGDTDLIANANALVCLCPSTEKNLGDGIIPLWELFLRSVRVCIGTDQHVRINSFAEARSLEELERLRLKQRLILNKEGDYLFQALLPSLISHGRASLDPRFDKASLIGQNADLVGISLPPEYQWHGPHAALEALMLAGNSSDIKTVITRGHMVLQEGQLIKDDEMYLIKEIEKFFRKINFN